MTAKQTAISDICADLKSSARCFIAFRTELNPVMDHIVEQYSKAQEAL